MSNSTVDPETLDREQRKRRVSRLRAVSLRLLLAPMSKLTVGEYQEFSGYLAPQQPRDKSRGVALVLGFSLDDDTILRLEALADRAGV